MGSDLYMLHQQIAVQSHSELVATLSKIRGLLNLELDRFRWADVIAEIDRVLNNASIR